jgi:hypothetical protein
VAFSLQACALILLNHPLLGLGLPSCKFSAEMLYGLVSAVRRVSAEKLYGCDFSVAGLRVDPAEPPSKT